jgi:hypothetical protein
MADSVQGSGEIRIGSGIGTQRYPLQFNIALTGSRQPASIPSIATGSWTSLYTGSCSTIRSMLFVNNGSGSIQISTTTSSLNTIAKLSPLDVAFIPWSGSTALFAQSFFTASALQYDLVV